MNTAIFRFEASTSIGAGHAIRSCVIADILKEKGWKCKIVTSSVTYNFINNLERFVRLDPQAFYSNPVFCDLLVIDHYDLDETYEKYFRPYTRKILVIDDLANRKHDCDIILDQTYGREAYDYQGFVPENCEILVGSNYILLRKEFIALRPKALEKRRQTKEIKKILISLGGSDPHNNTLKILQMVKDCGFKGEIDVVLGFDAPHYAEVRSYLGQLLNQSIIHVNADMPQLIFEADLAIGAAGSSFWERSFLGLPSIVVKTAENQSFCFSKISKCSATMSFEKNTLHKLLESIEDNYQEFVLSSANILDGLGVQKVINNL